MRLLASLLAGLVLLASSPAEAIVGGAALASPTISRSVVTIVGSRGTFCSGSLIAPTLVLTAAHCAQPGADYKIVQYGATRKPRLMDVKRVAIHPGFRMRAMLAHRATADVALLQLVIPARGKTPARLGIPKSPILAGAEFT
ncbi:MAG: trypsin-like serine protease, partial [Bradyrhizobium sp.]